MAEKICFNCFKYSLVLMDYGLCEACSAERNKNGAWKRQNEANHSPAFIAGPEKDSVSPTDTPDSC